MKAILCLLFLINFSLCLTQTRKGAYTFQREKSALINGSMIGGFVVEFTTYKPLKMAVIKIDTTLVYTDTQGHFRYKLPARKHAIRAGFIGYYLIDLGKISLQKGELINIAFRVKEDTTPLID